jgi:hypothetical protein
MPFEQAKPPADAERFASPELEMLADQLRHDAQWLAERYPAHKPRLPLGQPRRVRWLAVACVAALLLLAVDGWRMWRRPARPIQSPSDLASHRQQLPAKTVEALKEAAPASPAMTNAGSPVFGYNDLNGAEKEALLDLLEKRPPANIKVSL